jgi:succinoglycan biosynthesis protein ExoM
MKPHIAVCICTYKRPRLLMRLLTELDGQETDSLFTYSIVVADNDPMESAKPVLEEFASRSAIGVAYCVQPKQGIALTRNKSVETAKGDYIAFIDDDEFPVKSWLLTLFKVCQAHDADGAMGPVKPFYESQPPKWVIEGRFHDRRTWPEGHEMDWRNGKTGNLLFRKTMIEPQEQAFDPGFITGEDQDFFRRMTDRGYRIVWSNDAVAYEVVPPARWALGFLMRRALLRGKMDIRHPTFRKRDILKSFVAVPAYTIALPFLLLKGQHWFMKYLVRIGDHVGKVLAFFHVNPVGGTYVSD